MKSEKVVVVKSRILLVVVGLYSLYGVQKEAYGHSSTLASLNVPLWFEKNVGQADECVSYFSCQKSGSVYFTSKELALVIPTPTQSAILKIKFDGASVPYHVEAREEQEGKCNYFIGNDETQWLTNVPTYATVYYKDIYPNIDAVFYGNKGRLEYDMCVAPGGDPQQICVQFEGAQDLVLDGDGTLHIGAVDTVAMTMLKPSIYQIVDGNKIAVKGEFVMLTHDTIGFRCDTYDTQNTLIIDPILQYSTYLGGSGEDIGVAIAVARDDTIFVAGITSSPDFPTTPSAYQTTLIGTGNSFVTKFNVAQSRLIYSTYLGSASFRGNNVSDLGIDSAGNAYVFGTTDSDSFPTTPGAFQTTLNGLTNCFITQLNPTGSALVYSTYLGGSAEARGDQSAGMAVDSVGNVFLTGQTQSVDFPTTPGSYQPTLAGTNTNCFVTKLNATGTQLIYSTYLGGSNPSPNGDSGNDIVIDSVGNAYVTGSAESSNFPTTPGAFQTTLAGASNAFIAKLNSAGSGLVYSTFLGGSAFDEGETIALDSEGNAIVAGGTSSTDFPITMGAFQSTLRGAYNCFVTKLNTVGSALIYSTFLGGNNEDYAISIALDNQGNACIIGETFSSNFPVTADAFQMALAGNVNGFMTKLNMSGSDLIYSTYFGGSNYDTGLDIALNSNGDIYFTGFTTSPNFPTTADAYQATFSGTMNAFISLFVFSPAVPSNFQGKKIENRFFTQTDYINQLSWIAPVSLGGIPVEGYKLFRNGTLIAQIPASGPLIYNDHNRTQNQKYLYTLVSFNGSAVSNPVSITF